MKLTYDELMKLALENYSKGGDGIYECWDEQTYNDYVKEFGPITKTKARQMFKDDKAVYDDMMGWY